MTSLVSHGVRFPPLCGGGPTCWPSSSVTQPDSPVVRGWTVGGLGHGVDRDVFPRCAGVDRRPSCAAWRVCVFPRRAGVDRRHGRPRPHSGGFPPACGGGPRYAIWSASNRKFSPGVRGWTVPSASVNEHTAVFPRRTGVDRTRRRGGSCTASISPVVRGWTVGTGLDGVRFAVSPGVRGWTAMAHIVTSPGEVFPRCAGVDRGRLSISTRLPRFPPLCGGGPQTPPVIQIACWYSRGVRG